MPRAIVTSTYRYKRPPRKKKPVLLEVPAIVKRKAEARPLASEPKASRPALVRGMKAGNDNRPVEQPAAIVTAKKPRGRKAAWTDDGAETPESVKAFLARMVRPGGPLPPGVSE
jgi:hypothetical protein